MAATDFSENCLWIKSPTLCLCVCSGVLPPQLRLPMDSDCLSTTVRASAAKGWGGPGSGSYREGLRHSGLLGSGERAQGSELVQELLDASTPLAGDAGDLSFPQPPFSAFPTPPPGPQVRCVALCTLGKSQVLVCPGPSHPSRGAHCLQVSFLLFIRTAPPAWYYHPV